MSLDEGHWLMLTPAGALRAFADAIPDPESLALQSLLSGRATLDVASWRALWPHADTLLKDSVSNGWVETLSRLIVAPDVRLDKFVEHLIGTLSGEQCATLGSDAGFCLGRHGMPQDEADALCVAAADYSGFASRQSARGWSGAMRYVSFHSDSTLLLPAVTFVPFWVDCVGYWLILRGEPLINNVALVELMWGIKRAGARFARVKQ